MKIKKCNFFKRCTIAFLVLATTLLISQPAFAEEATSDDWGLFAQGNIWLPDIKNELPDGTNVEITLDDILDNLELTVMATMGAKKGKWTFLTDVVYLNLDHSQNKNLVDDGPVRLDLTNFEMKAWIVTPYASYNVLDSDRVNLNLLAGARYLWLEITPEIEKQILTTTSTSSSAESDNVWDGIVGVRGAIKLDEKWYLPFHFDVGTGDSDVTWQTYAGVGYKLDNFDLALGYRHLRWDFDDGAPLQQLYITGPMVGIKYWF